MTLKAKPYLTIVLIFKDEERFLKGWLDCFKGVADQYVCVDTGSTDRSVSLLQESGIQPLYFAWTGDFSAARNYALSYVFSTWVLALDADDRMDSSALDCMFSWFREERADAGFVQYQNLLEPIWPRQDTPIASIQYQVRLFRGDRGYRYKGVIHENVVPSVEEQGGTIAYSEVAMSHLGYAQDLLAAKIERNQRIIDREYERNPQSPDLMFYKAVSDFGPRGFCAQLLFSAWQKASGTLRQRIAAKILVWNLCYRSSPMLDEELPPARIAGYDEKFEQEALQHPQERAIAYVSMARRAWDQHRVEEAQNSLKKAWEDLEKSQDAKLFRGEVLDCLGIACAMQQDFHAAWKWFETYRQRIGPTVHNLSQRLRVLHALRDEASILALVQGAPLEYLQNEPFANLLDAMLKALPGRLQVQGETASQIRRRLRQLRMDSGVSQ